MKKRLRHRCFSVNIVKFLRKPTLKNSYEQLLLRIGVIHRGYPYKFGNFWDPLPLSRSVQIRLTTPSPCPCGQKAGIIWNIASCEQFTLKSKKNLIILFENNIKNIRMKTIFKMMSLHCVPYIPYWMNTSTIKILYTDILSNYLSKFHEYGSYNFFQADLHIWLTTPLPLSAIVHFCLTPSLSPLICGHPLWIAPYSNTDAFLWNLRNILKNT